MAGKTPMFKCVARILLGCWLACLGPGEPSCCCGSTAIGENCGRPCCDASECCGSLPCHDCPCCQHPDEAFDSASVPVIRRDLPSCDLTRIPFDCRKQEFPRGIPTSSQDEYFPPWIAAFSGRRSCCSATLSDASSSEIVSLRSDDSTSANRRMCHVRIRIIMQTGFNIP